MPLTNAVMERIMVFNAQQTCVTLRCQVSFFVVVPVKPGFLTEFCDEVDMNCQ